MQRLSARFVGTAIGLLLAVGPGEQLAAQVPSSLLPSLLNYAETWARNWNYGGYTVDSRFTDQYRLLGLYRDDIGAVAF